MIKINEKHSIIFQVLEVGWVADSLSDFESILYGILHFFYPRIEYPVEAVFPQENLCQNSKLF